MRLPAQPVRVAKDQLRGEHDLLEGAGDIVNPAKGEVGRDTAHLAWRMRDHADSQGFGKFEVVEPQHRR